MTTIGHPDDNKELIFTEALERFKNTKVNHPIIENVRKRILHRIKYPSGRSIIMVYGPTRVGKTTLDESCVEKLYEAYFASPDIDPGCIPYVSFEAPGAQDGRYSWRDHNRRLLNALNEPLLNLKIKYDSRSLITDENGHLRVDKSATNPYLRHVVESALTQRKVRDIFIDEAHHIGKVNSAKQLLDQMDTIKSLTLGGQVMHVMFGTYELRNLLNLSAQLDCRTEEIHFPRYDATKEVDIKNFQKSLRSFQKSLPVSDAPTLQDKWDWIYLGCLGCVGALKEWLLRALTHMHDNDRDRMLWNDLEATKDGDGRLEERLKEILEGEKEVFEKNDRTDTLYLMLGLNSNSKSGDHSSKPVELSSQENKTRRPKPGTPKPKRNRSQKPMEQFTDDINKSV